MTGAQWLVLAALLGLALPKPTPGSVGIVVALCGGGTAGIPFDRLPPDKRGDNAPCHACTPCRKRGQGTPGRL